MDLRTKLLNNTRIKETSILSESDVFNNRQMIPTNVPIINIALSGRIDGGFSAGTTMWAGPSKHFKTAFTLLQVRAFLDKYKDGIVLFYDNEFGSPPPYFKSFGIDTDRVIHTPIQFVEQWGQDLVNQLDNITRKDNVMIAVDSIGMLASRKELNDARDQKETVDMTRSKAVKSVFRMVSSTLAIKDIPMVVVNHTYKTLEMFSKDQVSSGTGAYYGAENIFVIGRQQDKKQGKDLEGFNFMIKTEKSRWSREGVIFPLNVKFASGISRYSGLLDLAVESGHVTKEKSGSTYRYTHPGVEKNFLEKDTNNATFWDPILQDETFRKWIEDKYSISSGSIMEEDDVDEVYESLEE